jgi:tetracycline repressor-like protein
MRLVSLRFSPTLLTDPVVRLDQRLGAGLPARVAAQVGIQRVDLALERVEHRHGDRDLLACGLGQRLISEPVAPVADHQLAAGDAPLPPGLDLLWGRRGGGTRGPKPGLSVDAIVETAVAIADAEGLDAVSMARVAKELGFTTMSLYRHVSIKDELLQLMWNASAQGAEGLVLEGEGWRHRLRMWAIVQREMLDRHPWITQMPMAARRWSRTP